MRSSPTCEQLDLAFAFEFLHAPWEPAALRDVVERASRVNGIAWVLSNHDFPRLATRLGADAARAAAVLLLTLPGAAFVYQGDEIGMADGPGGSPPVDRFGRDPQRHPMQWERDRGRRLQQTASPGCRSAIRRRAASPPSATTVIRSCTSIAD